MFPSWKKPSRLAQWKGQTRSTRQDESLWRCLGQPGILARLGAVWLTTVAVTLLGLWWGHPFPYRLGLVYPHDLRARVDFEVLNFVELLNQHPDKSVDRYAAGYLIVPRGQPIQDAQLDLLREEHRAFRNSLTAGAFVRRALGLCLIFSLLAMVVMLYASRFQIGLARHLPTIVGVCLLVFATLFLAVLLDQAPWHAPILPLTMTCLILALAYNPQFALLMSVSLALATTILLGLRIEGFLQQVGGLAAAVLLLRHVRTRTQLVQISTGAGLAFAAMTAATGLLTGQTWMLIGADACRHFLLGSLAGFLLTGLLPLVEKFFGIVTDISLLELADGSHPLLQELVRRAPGTYTHSMTIATLAEAAAEAIGANPLLVRVGSYFHDIGKMTKPEYFIENQTGANRHDDLEPALSTLVIIGHVKDGLALAEEYRLPRPVTDFIQQHHGTTLVEYFYREAMRLNENQGRSPAEFEASFRYPGPKPQNRENGIVMLSDAVESTSRSLNQPTPASLKKLVHDLVMKRLLDGQFEECGMTLSELHAVEASLSKSLIALFHARIKYPDEIQRAG